MTIDIDMGQAVLVREQLLAGEKVKVSFNDLVVKACAKALTRFPLVNASFTPDAIVTHAEVHIGVAVAVPDGLIVPVVRNADRKSVAEISREVKDLATRAKEKQLRPEEFMGSTFSISNLGMMDVTEFTAIINPPEAAILAVGALRKEPVVVERPHRDRPPDEGDPELRPPGHRRRPGRLVPGRGPPPPGAPGQPVPVDRRRPSAPPVDRHRVDDGGSRPAWYAAEVAAFAMAR